MYRCYGCPCPTRSPLVVALGVLYFMWRSQRSPVSLLHHLVTNRLFASTTPKYLSLTCSLALSVVYYAARYTIFQRCLSYKYYGIVRRSHIHAARIISRWYFIRFRQEKPCSLNDITPYTPVFLSATNNNGSLQIVADTITLLYTP